MILRHWVALAMQGYFFFLFLLNSAHLDARIYPLWGYPKCRSSRHFQSHYLFLYRLALTRWILSFQLEQGSFQGSTQSTSISKISMLPVTLFQCSCTCSMMAFLYGTTPLVDPSLLYSVFINLKCARQLVNGLRPVPDCVASRLT